MQSAQATQDPIRNLDFLRAVAVLMVVCAHFFGLGPDWLDKGFVRLHLLGLGGVMLFFVHTSLVLMMSLERMLQEARQNAQSWRSIVISFYIRRVFRIYPLSICIILLTVLLHIPQDPFFPYIKLSLSEVAANLLLVQNLTKMRDAIGPLWSLPWEVQMYVTLPFLFMLARTRKLWALALLGAAVVLVNAGGIAAGMRVVRIIDNVPCFLSGVLAYMLIRRRTLPKLPSWLWPVALAALIAAATLFGDWTMWKAYWGRWAVCLAVGLLIPISAICPRVGYRISLTPSRNIPMAFICFICPSFGWCSTKCTG